jgi:hypothetical protein
MEGWVFAGCSPTVTKVVSVFVRFRAPLQRLQAIFDIEGGLGEPLDWSKLAFDG